MLPLAIAGAVIVGAAVLVARRKDVRGHALARGWDWRPRDDELPTTWTLPPFTELRSPHHDPPPQRRSTYAENVCRFTVQGSTAMSMTLVETIYGAVPERAGQRMDDSSVQRTHVVAIWTRQHLPRTMIRHGIDVYALPVHEGLHRVRDTGRVPGRGVLAVTSADPVLARTLPLRSIAQGLEAITSTTLVADGDWVYAYRPGDQQIRHVDVMIEVIERLARGVPGRRWPVLGESSSGVYGAV